jgi:hypothetical protein
LALTAVQLTGYQKAEFAKASKWRMRLLVFQFLASLPAALAVVVTSETLLYFFAIGGAALLALWWWARARYMAARSAAHSARRASLVVNGLGYQLSAGEHQRLRQLFTVNERDADQLVDPAYYASQLASGASRLGEMLEESAFYSKAVHAASARIMTNVLVGVVVLLAITAISSVPFVERATALVFVKIVLAAYDPLIYPQVPSLASTVASQALRNFSTNSQTSQVITVNGITFQAIVSVRRNLPRVVTLYPIGVVR